MARDSWLKRLIWLRGSPAGGSGASYEKTVGPAPIISISDAKPKPAKSLIVGMEPIQDLHGYDSPWPAGGGANKWDEEWEVGGIDATTGENSDGFTDIIRSTNYIPVDDSKTYYFCCLQGSFAVRSRFYDANKGYIGSLPASGQQFNTNATFQPPSGAAYMRFATQATYGVTYNHDIAINYPSTVTTYSPYSNLCPITGRTGVTVERTGVNVWDEEWEPGTFDGSGEKAPANDVIRTKNYISVKPSTNYYQKNGGSGTFVGYWYDSEYHYISSVSGSSKTITSPASAAFFRFRMSSGYGTTYNHDISINYPATDTDYHAYTGQSYPVSWQSEAGTVYGGTVDVVSGVLTVTHGIVDFVDVPFFKTSSTSSVGGSVFSVALSSVGDGMAKRERYHPNTMICMDYLTGASSVWWVSDMPDYSANSNGENLFIADSRYATIDEFNAAKSGIKMVYELAEPQTYQLTPTQIQLLKGSNTLWSDGDSLTLTYLGTTPANLLGGMLGGGLGGGYYPPAEQDPEELTEPEATETDEPTKETPAEEGENNGE